MTSAMHTALLKTRPLKPRRRGAAGRSHLLWIPERNGKSSIAMPPDCVNAFGVFALGCQRVSHCAGRPSIEASKGTAAGGVWKGGPPLLFVPGPPVQHLSITCPGVYILPTDERIWKHRFKAGEAEKHSWVGQHGM